MADPDEPETDLLAFTPVPVTGKGAKWTPKVQSAFIDALSRCGVVRTAAQAVGCTAQSANRLRRQPGADSFAAAWDWAIEIGLDDQRARAFQHIRGMVERPLVRSGEVVGTVSEPHFRLMFAALRTLDAELSGKRRRLPCRHHTARRDRSNRQDRKLSFLRRFANFILGGKSGKRRRPR